MNNEMTLLDYVVTLRRKFLAILVLGVLGATGAYSFAAATPSVYEASTSVLVTSELGSSGSDLVQGSTYVENLVSSYVLLARSEKVLQPVIDQLNLDASPRQLARVVSAESPLNTVLINVSVKGRDPKQAANLADAVTDSLARAVADVSPVVGGKPAIRLTTTQSADVPRNPVEPNRYRWTALGALAGLLLGVGYALLRRTLGSAIADAADVARVTRVPVVGEIVEARKGMTLPASVLQDPSGIEAESLRGLAANLSFLGVDKGLRSLVMTSGSPGESKSSIAAATALVLAEAAKRVLLIDADMRAPSLHLLANLDNSIGLSTVLIGGHKLEVAAQPWGADGLHVLTSGPLVPNPGQLLSSDAMRSLIARAEESYDVVVVDSGPLLSVVDAVWLGHMVDGVLVVVRRGRTSTRTLLKTLDTLESANTPISGVVISRVARATRTEYVYSATAPPA